MRFFAARILVLAALALTLSVPPAMAGLETAKTAIAAGDGVAAIRSLQPLADKGDVQAMVLLGSIYQEGLGRVSRDSSRAMTFFRKAAEGGNATAQAALGRAYANGDGVSRSPNQAYYWLAVAAANAPATGRAALLKERDNAALQISRGEVEQANDMASRFLGRSIAADTERKRPVSLIPKPAAAAPSKPKSSTSRSAGSGFIVAADGKVVTNAHVVPQCKTIEITFADGSKREAQLLARDKGEDLALLSVEAENLPVAGFRNDTPLRSGDGVVVVGFPLSSVLSAEANVTAGVISALAGMKGDQRFFQLTAPVQKGNSGGPLADMNGAVIGMVTKKLDAMKIAGRTGDLPQNVNFALKSERIEAFLAKNDVDGLPATEIAEDTLSVADVGERIKRVTVFVVCEK